MVNMIVAIILYFSAFSLIVSQYVSKFLKKRKEGKELSIIEEEAPKEGVL